MQYRTATVGFGALIVLSTVAFHAQASTNAGHKLGESGGIISSASQGSMFTQPMDVTDNPKASAGCALDQERVDHPVVDLDKPIAEQINLYGGDRVLVVGMRGKLEAVRFGPEWEPFIEGHTYVVWGDSARRVVVAFKGSAKLVKLEVRYACNTDKPRDVRKTEPGAPVQKK